MKPGDRFVGWDLGGPDRAVAVVATVQADGAVKYDRLPEGLIVRDGSLLFECRVCGEWTEWQAEPEDFEIGNTSNVCGGSPRCCP